MRAQQHVHRRRAVTLHGAGRCRRQPSSAAAIARCRMSSLCELDHRPCGSAGADRSSAAASTRRSAAARAAARPARRDARRARQSPRRDRARSTRAHRSPTGPARCTLPRIEQQLDAQAFVIRRRRDGSAPAGTRCRARIPSANRGMPRSVSSSSPRTVMPASRRRASRHSSSDACIGMTEHDAAAAACARRPSAHRKTAREIGLRPGRAASRSAARETSLSRNVAIAQSRSVAVIRIGIVFARSCTSRHASKYTPYKQRFDNRWLSLAAQL